MENIPENFQPQLVEGILGKWDDHWQEKLPPEIKPEMVNIFINNKGEWCWHLKPDFINDEFLKKAYIKERAIWTEG